MCDRGVELVVRVFGDAMGSALCVCVCGEGRNCAVGGPPAWTGTCNASGVAPFAVGLR